MIDAFFFSPFFVCVVRGETFFRAIKSKPSGISYIHTNLNLFLASPVPSLTPPPPYPLYPPPPPLLSATFSPHRSSPNQQCFASAITACARALEAHSALQLLRNMREDGVPPNDIVLNAVVDACGKVILNAHT